MRANDITVLVPPKTAAPTPQRMATRGTVTIPPASLTDDTVTVVLPSYSPDYGWPCRWIRQGNTLPAIGAECLVLWDETGAGTVVQWAGAGVALPTVADVAALDARLDVLEATRTVRGTVSSAGAAVVGSGFSSARNGAGDYTITFTTAFSGVPSMVPGLGTTAGLVGIKQKDGVPVTENGFSVYTYSASALTDSAFHFVAIGPT